MQPGSSGTSATNDASSSLQKMMTSQVISTLALLKTWAAGIVMFRP